MGANDITFFILTVRTHHLADAGQWHIAMDPLWLFTWIVPDAEGQAGHLLPVIALVQVNRIDMQCAGASTSIDLCRNMFEPEIGQVDIFAPADGDQLLRLNDTHSFDFVLEVHGWRSKEKGRPDFSERPIVLWQKVFNP